MVRIDSIYLLNHVKSLSKRESFDKPHTRKSLTHNDEIESLYKAQNSTAKVVDTKNNDEKNDTDKLNNKVKERRNSKRNCDHLMKPEEKELLLKKSHLHLGRKKITHLDDMRCCKNVKVLFLQENHLKRIGHLRHLRYLQELYLHDNQISRIEGLNNLNYLTKLMLPRNRIGVVEGLPPNLEELQIENQFHSPGDILLLDPQALMRIQESLTFLDISENHLTEIGAVGLLNNLQVFRASYNNINNLEHICLVVNRLCSLIELDFRGNPVTTQRKYRRDIINHSQETLEILDKKTITKENRLFLRNCENSPNNNSAKIKKPGAGTIFISEHFLFDARKGLTTDEISLDNENGNCEMSKYVLGSLNRTEFDVLLKKAKHQLTISNETDAESTTQTQKNSVPIEPLLPTFIPNPFLRHKKK